LERFARGFGSEVVTASGGAELSLDGSPRERLAGFFVSIAGNSASAVATTLFTLRERDGFGLLDRSSEVAGSVSDFCAGLRGMDFKKLL
jgi:hypothetical protein